MSKRYAMSRKLLSIRLERELSTLEQLNVYPAHRRKLRTTLNILSLIVADLMEEA